jgi:predicted RND superfamily exporter protein
VTERLAGRLLRRSLARPRATLAAWLAAALVAGFGVARLHVDTNVQNVLDRRDPSWAFYETSLERFGGDEIVVVALRGARPFDPELAGFVIELSGRLASIPGVRRVDSLATVPVVHGRADGTLELEPALSSDPAEPFAGDGTAARVRADRIAPRSLVSDDGSVFAVNVILEDPRHPDYERVVDAIEAAVGARPAWISGVPVYRRHTSERIVREVALFVPLTLVTMAGVLLAVFRSLRAVPGPLLAAGLGTWVLCGVMGALGIPLTITTMILPSVLLAVGCAYAIHLLAAAPGLRGAGALEPALAPLALPIALCGVTTAIGFASMCTVRIDAILYVGALGAVGVLAVLAAALTVTPAALSLWPLPERSARVCEQLRERAAPAVLRLAARRPRLVVAGWVLAFAVVGLGMTRLRVETDVTRWFEPGNPVRDSYEAIRRELSGISPMNVVIESHAGAAVTAPEALAAIDALAAHLRGLPKVGKAVSLADPLRQLHGGFVDDPRQPLPAGQDLVEQYLLLLESVPQLADLVSADRSAANVLLRLDDNGSAYLLGVAAAAEEWWAEHGPPGFSARTTGIMFEFARAADSIALGQIRGFGSAFAAVSLVLLLVLRSLRLAGVALVPNLVPVFIAFGAMGLAGISLDAATVLIGSIALGIAVDDTVHLLVGYHEGRRAGTPRAQAVEASLRQSFPAIVQTALVVALGFAVLGLSGFSFIRNLGLVTAGLMVLCLAAELNLLPAMLLGDRDAASRSGEAGGPLGEHTAAQTPSGVGG